MTAREDDLGLAVAALVELGESGGHAGASLVGGTWTDSLAYRLGAHWTLLDDGTLVLDMQTVTVDVPTHRSVAGVYVTVNEVGAALCTALLGHDPGVGRQLGEAWSVRVEELRRGVQQDRQM